ncbi:MAG: DUF4956 domain-containing protein [Acidimicrobiales bacterium]
MKTTLPFVLDLVAVSILTFGLYLPRHRRRDLVVSYLGVNIGVLAVAEAFTSTDVTAGLGLGLFGVLSIIRLRSSELDQPEVAYYFVSLALGVLGGVPISPMWLAPALMAALLAVLYIGDHGRLLGRYRSQRMNLDRAFTDENQLIAHLERLLSAKVHRITVRRVDLVNDTTDVDVRFEIAGGPSPIAPSAGSQAVELEA